MLSAEAVLQPVMFSILLELWVLILPNLLVVMTGAAVILQEVMGLLVLLLLVMEGAAVVPLVVAVVGVEVPRLEEEHYHHLHPDWEFDHQ